MDTGEPGPSLALAKLAVSVLGKGEHERYAILEDGVECLEHALRALMSSDIPAWPAIDGLLGVADALGTTFESPAAASTIIAIIDRHPEARALVPGLREEDRQAETKHVVGGSKRDLPALAPDRSGVELSQLFRSTRFR